MAPLTRMLSSILLAAGIVFLLAGMTAAMGSTLASFVAGIATIAVLLYAGSVWFGAPPAALAGSARETVIVFDRELQVTAGPGAGRPLLPQFPLPVRSEVEARCRAALRGESSRFVCTLAGARLVIEVSPVASVTHVVLFGTLIMSAGLPEPSLELRPAALPAPGSGPAESGWGLQARVVKVRPRPAAV